MDVIIFLSRYLNNNLADVSMATPTNFNVFFK